VARWRVAVLFVACAILTCAPQQQAASSDPILVLVSFDGWRWDYMDRYGARNLQTLASRGARARAMIPSFPVLTFPNHYTIVTGLRPEHHGIVANSMRDPSMPERFSMSAETAKDARWWLGEPLWGTAIRQGRRAATMFWPGSEADIGGVRPNFWKPFDKSFATTARVQQALDWLALPEAERPTFVSIYFDEVDSAGHDYGIDSRELVAATQHLDAALGQLVDGITRAHLAERTTIAVVSDHGMAALSPDRVIMLDDFVDTQTIDIVQHGAFLALAPKDGDVDAVYAKLHGKHPALVIYRRGQMPGHLRYRGNPRIEPIVGVVKEGWYVTTRRLLAETPLHLGAHGFAPRDPEMGALFVAAGPRVVSGIVLDPFENVDVYNFLCAVLNLTPAKNDGGMRLVRRAIVTPSFAAH
jgi:predicted AlkP superfamily pyrophosphatase or phosphodiesterase